jgi:hypothetical protein
MWKRLRRNPRAVVCLLASACSLASAPRVGAQEGTKRALIIAIGEYGVAPANPQTGRPLLSYRDLSSANDVVLVRGALERQGFAPRNIRVLPDAQATAAGIRSALQRLASDTERGDVVVIHYSGHGDRLPNDNPAEDDEIDGRDEALVGYGAPAERYAGYDGSLHFRDDELGGFIAQIRARAGASGNVTVFLDACYSGTATRGPGDGAELATRGGAMELPEPVFAPGRAAGTRGAPEDDRGTSIELARAAATRGPGDEQLAPFVVFSAASPRQMAKETYDVDGRTKVGSLSYAMARSLSEAAPGTTNAGLFAAMTRSLLGKVSDQTPQMEGDADRALFSNRLVQQFAYVVVDSVSSEGVVLAGGTLVGLNPGTQLAIYPMRTNSPDGTPLATVEVREATATRAVAVLAPGRGRDDLRGAWAFVTQRSYGELALRVRLDPSLRAQDREGLTRRLGGGGTIRLVDEGADVVIADRGGRPEARAMLDSLVLARGADSVVRRVEEFARNTYLRRLSFASPELDLVLEFAPGVQYDAARDRCSAADWAGAEGRPEHLGGGQWRIAPGAYYDLRVRNTGAQRAYFYVVELRPGGQIDVIWPEAGAWGEEIEPGATWELDGCVRPSTGDAGTEVLKLFATSARQDLRPWFQSERTRAATPDLAVSREIIVNIQPNQENQE